MASLTQSTRRILAAYGGERADRIPICSPISWHPMNDIDAAPPDGWKARPEFVKVARMVREHCDIRPPYNPVGFPRLFSSISYGRFLEAADEFIETLPPEQVGPIRWRHTALLHTPQGDLTWAL